MAAQMTHIVQVLNAVTEYPLTAKQLSYICNLPHDLVSKTLSNVFLRPEKYAVRLSRVRAGLGDGCQWAYSLQTGEHLEPSVARSRAADTIEQLQVLQDTLLDEAARIDELIAALSVD